MYKIAEIGFNHEGNKQTALEMIHAASKSGASAVKFQTFRAQDIAAPNSPHFDLIKSGEMDYSFHEELVREAKLQKIDFLSTPFSLWAVELLEKLGVSAYKVASMDCTNLHLLNAIAETGKPIFISTGMASLEEIATTIDFLNTTECGEITLLHCVAKYPAPAEELNLEAIGLLKELFGRRTGYSDHYPGTSACLAAVMLGAEVIETHFTLDNTKEGGDHFHSANPQQFKQLVDDIQQFQLMRGNKAALLKRSDRSNAQIFRRGIYASRDLLAGEILSEADLLLCRPESELSPNDLSEILGRKIKCNISKFHPLKRELL